MTDGPAELADRVDRSLAARARLTGRPWRDTVAALAEAARCWRTDPALAAALPAESRLDASMVDEVLPLVAAALDADAVTSLVERAYGATGGAADGPALVAHVLASNVPGLAVPAIALGCLAGAAVLMKSGRHDTHSAPAFQRALAGVDPDLAATVVTTYWPGGDPAYEPLLARADVVVATGRDATLDALAARLPRPVVGYGTRLSVAAVGREALGEADDCAARLALDVALYEQRGCLSPHAVYVEDGGTVSSLDFARRLAAALDALAARLPPGPATVEERAARRALVLEAEWEPGVGARVGPGGVVIHDRRPGLRATCGARTIRVHPMPALRALPEALPAGVVECVGIAASDDDVAALAPRLARLGVSRVCPLGRMQRPPLAWPRGQRPPLAALLGVATPPALQVEAP
jgi:hypothetical protein